MRRKKDPYEFRNRRIVFGQRERARVPITTRSSLRILFLLTGNRICRNGIVFFKLGLKTTDRSAIQSQYQNGQQSASDPSFEKCRTHKSSLMRLRLCQRKNRFRKPSSIRWLSSIETYLSKRPPQIENKNESDRSF